MELMRSAIQCLGYYSYAQSNRFIILHTSSAIVLFDDGFSYASRYEGLVLKSVVRGLLVGAEFLRWRNFIATNLWFTVCFARHLSGFMYLNTVNRNT